MTTPKSTAATTKKKAATRKRATTRVASKAAAERTAVKAAENNDVIEIAAKKRQTIPVDLVGVHYDVYPPKSLLALRLGQLASKVDSGPEDDMEAVGDMMDAMSEWVHQAFGQSDGDRVMLRLEDGADSLEVDHVMNLMNKIAERSARFPT